jgi:hypothetical protein
MMGNESKDHRTDANIYSIECRTGGEAGGCSGVSGMRSQKAEGALGVRTVGQACLGVVQKNENEEEMLDIQAREGSSGLKSNTPIDLEAVVMKTIERTAENLHRAHNTGWNWIWMRHVSV